MKPKKKDKQIKIVRIKSNPRVEEIIKDYPETLAAHPRGLFEEQLRKHLLKHDIK